MLSQSLSTIQTPPVKRELFKTANKTNSSENCQYCQMKRKFGFGGNGDMKCFEHSVKIEFETQDKSFSEEEHPAFLNAEEMVDVLEQVDEGLEYYWEHLNEKSGGSIEKVHKELEPVLGCVKKIK